MDPYIVGLFLLLAFQAFLFYKTRRSFGRVAKRWKKEVRLDRNSLLNSSDAAKLLDQQLFGEWSYDAQRRLGVVTPLLGVIVTAFKFHNISGLTGDVLDSGILELYSGVLLGASAAVWSQFLLFWIHRDWARFRVSVDLEEESTGITQAAAQFSSGLQFLLADTTTRCMDLLSEVQRTVTSQMQESSKLIENSMRTQEFVAKQIGDVFSQQLSEVIKKSSDATRKALEPYERTLIDNYRAIADAMENVRTLHTSVASTLNQALSGGESLARLSKDLDNVSTSLTAAFVDLSEGAFPSLRLAIGSFSNQVTQFAEGVTRSSLIVSDSTTQFSDLTAGLAAIGDTMRLTAGGLRESSDAFGGQCREMVASQREVHERISENLDRSLEVLGHVAALNHEIASALTVAKEGSGVMEKITADMKTVSGSFEKSVKDLAESGLPTTLELLGGFATGVTDLRSQVQFSAESLQQVTDGFNSAIASLSKSSDSIHSAVIKDIEGLRESAHSLQGINAEISHSLDQAAKSRLAMQTVTSELTATSESLGPALKHLSQQGISGAQRLLEEFSAEVRNLSERMRGSSSTFQTGFGRLERLVEAIEETRLSLEAAASGVNSSSAVFSGALENTSTLLLTSARSLGETLDEEIGEKLVNAQRTLASGLASASESAQDLPDAIRGLSETLKSGKSQIDSLGNVSSEVSSSLSIMRQVVDSLKLSVDRQTESVSHWRAILDAIPESLQVRTDNSVKTLIAHLAEITADVGRLADSVRNSR
jgi:hypothetical protein